MNVLAIIQARMGSTRLPGKVTKQLGVYTALELCYRRVQRSGARVAIACPAPDLRALQLFGSLDKDGRCCDRHWFAWDGPENDVLGRYIACATSQRPWPDIIVRITADCPLVLPEWIQYCVSQVALGKFYYGERHLGVKGWDVEAFTIGALLESVRDVEREHVTTGMQERYGPGYWPDDGPRLTLDTQEDYDRLTAIANKLKNPVTASAQDILAAWEEV